MPGYHTAGRTIQLGLFLIAIFLFSPGIAHAQQKQTNDIERHAIVVGINEYRNVTDLQYATRDAIVLGETLENLGYKVTRLLDNADPQELKAKIVHAGELMDQGYGRDTGTLLITFSGHGYSRDGTNYLAFGRAQTDGNTEENMSVSELLLTMRNSGIGRQFLFVDACRNLPVRSGSATWEPFVPDDSVRGQNVLFSTAPGMLSYEDSDLGQGVFSHFLVQALTGAAALDKDGLLLFDEAYKYVRREVSRYVSSRFNEEQYPHRAGESSGLMILGKPGANLNKQGWLSSQTAIDQPNPKPRTSRAWKVLGTIVGILAVGALVADSGSDTDSRETGVTLVVPTP